MKTIMTEQADCRDCHRCMRSCPVKAVGIEQGQARLIEEKCVLCGRCVVECPQSAKKVENQLPVICQAIASGRQVVLSLAPSFVGSFGEYSQDELWARLLGLGFAGVEETAVGAEVVSRYYSQMLSAAEKTVISACCPVIVNTIKKYYPSLTDNLAPVVSPAQAHARMLKDRFGEQTFVVFAGPCIAKIAEMREPGSRVDAVITFEQLKSWLAGTDAHSIAKPRLTRLRKAPAGARHFPVPGGILKSFTRSDYTATDIIAVDGLPKCMEVFDGLIRGEIAPSFIEALACSGGCADGPASGTKQCSPAKRLKILDFAVKGKPASPQALPESINYYRLHTAEPVEEVLPSEEQIRTVLRGTGKYSRQDEKNCGACGFQTCREKAVAVCQGLTSIDTCVPYMRSKAESFANIIVDNSPNAIIVVNSKLAVQEFNPAAEHMFDCRKESMKGKVLTEIMDCADIASVARNGEKALVRRVKIAASGTVASQMVIPVAGQDLVIVVMTDITAQEKHAREMEKMKCRTVEKASEIINKQMQVAQEIAGLLGETTAETKAALIDLVSLLKVKGGD